MGVYLKHTEYSNIFDFYQMQFTCTGTLRIEKNKDEKKRKKNAIHFCPCIDKGESISAFYFAECKEIDGVFLYTENCQILECDWALMCRLSYILWVQWWNPSTGWDRRKERLTMDERKERWNKSIIWKRRLISIEIVAMETSRIITITEEEEEDEEKKKRINWWTDQILKCNAISYQTQQRPIHLLLTFELFQVVSECAVYLLHSRARANNIQQHTMQSIRKQIKYRKLPASLSLHCSWKRLRKWHCRIDTNRKKTRKKQNKSKGKMEE